MFGIEGGFIPCVQCLQFWWQTSLLLWLQPTFAGKVIDIVTAKPDTEEGREAALKAVNSEILLIVVVIVVGYVSLTGYLCVQAQHSLLHIQLLFTRPKLNCNSKKISVNRAKNLRTVNMWLYISHACFLGRWHIPFECRSIATMIRAYLFTSASERVVARLKKDLFSHLIEQASHLWSNSRRIIDVCLNVGFQIVDCYNCEARDHHLNA